jgi:small subunit ribosomal protein S24e
LSKSELLVVKDDENKLLGRREVTIQLKHSQGATPTRSEVRQRIAGNFNVDQELIRITRMETKTNTWVTVCYADIYTSKEDAERLTSKHLALRDLPKEEKEKIKAEKKKAGKAKSGKK